MRRLRRLLPSVSSAYLEYTYVAVRSEADESTTLSTAWACSRSRWCGVFAGFDLDNLHKQGRKVGASEGHGASLSLQAATTPI